MTDLSIKRPFESFLQAFVQDGKDFVTGVTTQIAEKHYGKVITLAALEGMSFLCFTHNSPGLSGLFEGAGLATAYSLVKDGRAIRKSQFPQG